MLLIQWFARIDIEIYQERNKQLTILRQEVLEKIIDLIIEHGFENIIEFMEYYHKHRKEHDLPDTRILYDVINSNADFIRLHFEGNYQQNK